jgi:hypothetical protein
LKKLGSNENELWRPSGLVVIKFDSRSKGCGQNTKWKWGQSHARVDSCTQFCFIVEKIRKIGKRSTPKKLFYKGYNNKQIYNQVELFLLHDQAWLQESSSCFSPRGKIFKDNMIYVKEANKQYFLNKILLNQ